MPPKKNVSKSEKLASSVDSAPPKQKSTKKPTTVDAEAPAGRTLRPRKPSATTEPAKVQKPAKKLQKDANGVVANTKKTTEKGKKRKVEDRSEEGEPTERKTKIEGEEDEDNNANSASASSIYDFKANTLQGEEISLSNYKGHVCIIVNVASKCGHTPSNYKELVELHDKYGDEKGLKILAFPCNQFGKQEPGNADKIAEFAKNKNVKFDIFEKINVNGKNAHPLWEYLTSQKDGPKGSKIGWNFTKFLINKGGQVVERFEPTVKPLALVEQLEKIW